MHQKLCSGGCCRPLSVYLALPLWRAYPLEAFPCLNLQEIPSCYYFHFYSTKKNFIRKKLINSILVKSSIATVAFLCFMQPTTLIMNPLSSYLPTFLLNYKQNGEIRSGRQEGRGNRLQNLCQSSQVLTSISSPNSFNGPIHPSVFLCKQKLHKGSANYLFKAIQKLFQSQDWNKDIPIRRPWVKLLL